MKRLLRHTKFLVSLCVKLRLTENGFNRKGGLYLKGFADIFIGGKNGVADSRKIQMYKFQSFENVRR